MHLQTALYCCITLQLFADLSLSLSLVLCQVSNKVFYQNSCMLRPCICVSVRWEKGIGRASAGPKIGRGHSAVGEGAPPKGPCFSSISVQPTLALSSSLRFSRQGRSQIKQGSFRLLLVSTLNVVDRLLLCYISILSRWSWWTWTTWTQTWWDMYMYVYINIHTHIHIIVRVI